ncbi:hypothetical protein SAMN04487996_12116 [Dyadobacter soli]|uniref:Secreted protein n=1 Tax=Dyadobacter soli TaxID=659014 RepID=A0A1G7VVR6_9BACT|nr:DUF6660 family protein [Dyadobacter soli]SDG63671.1 hypothetical protein SAMN04487996_12116 [Dyadobacter soli]
MKVVLAYLLAFYVLALSCIPCQDEASPPDSGIAAAVVSDSDNAHQEAIDLCSPFCICACCASVTISATVAALPENAVSQLIPPASFSYLQILYTGDKAGFWQPPQERV